MNRKSHSTVDSASKANNPIQSLKYIDYLSKEDQEDEDYIAEVLKFMTTFKTSELLEIENLNILKKIIQHTLKASSKLLINDKGPKSLELLESVRTLVSQIPVKDPVFEKLKALIYNNISSYCSSIGDYAMAAKFLENCLKKDIGTSPALTCLFYNNLAGIYYAAKKYEKAFKYTKKSLYILEPEIFPEIDGNSARQLKEDPVFKKKLLILLTGYLTMGTILEGYQLNASFQEGASASEMSELSPKDFFKNAYGLAKKYLGESHEFTQRLWHSYNKSEAASTKEFTTPDDSDLDKQQKSPTTRLEQMLKSINIEENIPPRRPVSIRKNHGSVMSSSTKSISNPPTNNSFLFKTQQEGRVRKSHKNIDSSRSSQEDSFDGPGNRRPTRPSSGNRFKPYNPYLAPQPEPYYLYHRPTSASFRPDFYGPPSFMNMNNTADQTQILLGLVIQNQKELSERLNQRSEESKNKNNPTTFANIDHKVADSKDDLRIAQLQDELEKIKQKIRKIDEAQVVEEKDKTGKHSNASNTMSYIPEPNTLSAVKIPNNKPQFFANGNGFSSNENIMAPDRRESSVSTKSSGQEHAPHLSQSQPITKIKINNQTEKEFPDPPNNNMLGSLSPIPREEKFAEYPNLHKKEPGWVPGKYSDPASRKFPLDLSRVNGFQGTEEAVRDRVKNDEKPADTQGGSSQSQMFTKTDSNPSQEMSKSVPKLTKTSEKVTINKIQPTKEVGSAAKNPSSSATVQSNSTNSFAKQESTEKMPLAINGKALPSASTAPLTSNKDQTDKDTSISIKATPERGDQSLENQQIKTDSDRSKSLNTEKRPSFSIPTSIDYMDSPAGSHNNPSSENKQPKYALIKKRLYFDENTQYTIVCRANWSKDERIFKLQLIPIDEKTGQESDKVESELQLHYKDLRKIIKYVEYKDIMPVTFHMKQIKNFFSLARWLLMPFTTIRINEQGNKEIAIYPKPPNLLTNSLSDMPTVEFMGGQCVIFLIHISRNTFRIVLTDPENVEEAVRIDVDFDQTSFDMCFQRSGGKAAQLRSVDAAMKIVSGFDDDADDDEVTDFKEIATKLRDPERVDEEELESFKVIHENLAEELGNILKDMEGFLASYGLEKISQMVDEKELKYCKLKINNKMKKTTMHFIWDKPDKQILEVKVQNFYETFAPDAKVKAIGFKDYPYDNAWKHFGLTYNSLDTADKLGICSMVAEIFNLDVFDKEIPKDDFDRYEENAIEFVPVEVGCFQRIFLGEKYKFPMTLSLVGIKGEPKGIRATVYNLDDASELGAFFYINPQAWSVPENDKKKKKQQRMATLTLIEHYYLDYILKKCGWEILKDSLVLDKRPNRIDIVGIKMFKEIRNVEQIENVLNPDTVMKYFGEKDEVEA